MKNSKDASEEISTSWIIGEIEKILYPYKLNNVIRYGLNRNEGHLRTQSVAEHVYNMLILAHYFLDLEDPEKKMDYQKIVRMILMHDMGEIETGDIVMGIKNEIHVKAEDEAILVVREKTPKFIREHILDLYNEFESPESPESRFVKAIDKIEAQFWKIGFCNISMIKTVTTLEMRHRNEKKRRELYPKLGFRIIEKFAHTLDDMGRDLGLYLEN